MKLKSDYSANDIAVYILRYENSCGRKTNNLRLQKLLYYVQAQFLVNTPEHRKCFFEDLIAWDFGPVILNVFRKYKYYGCNIIPIEAAYEADVQILYKDKILIKSMLDYLSRYSDETLVKIVHLQEPWRNAYYNTYDKVITTESMYKYYKCK